MNMNPQYVLNGRGKKVAVILTVGQYKRLLDKAEELWAIKAYDDAKASGETAIPFEEAMARIRRNKIKRA
jgi:hypothetical protein